jgi:elongation factor P--beta-lysine ligase
MNPNDDNDINWQPTSDYKAAKKRQAKLNAIRSYFSDNEVVEVDTPILSTCAVSDINIESIQTTTSLHPRTILLSSYVTRILYEAYVSQWLQRYFSNM